MTTRYSYAQLKDLWVQAGGSRSAAPIAAAVAMAESGGRPDAYNARNRNGTVDRGLWQINSVHGAQSTFDPVANARAAVGISKGGTDWRPWCTAWSDGHCGGTFLGPGAPVMKFLPAGQTSSGVVPTAGTKNATLTTTLPGPFDPGTAVDAFRKLLSSLFGEVADKLKMAIFYYALTIVGALTILIGLILLLFSTRTAQQVVRKQLFPPGPVEVAVVPARSGRSIWVPPEPDISSTSQAPSQGGDTLELPFISPPKVKPYKARHYMKVKKEGTRTVIPKRGDAPDDWPTTPKYQPRH